MLLTWMKQLHKLVAMEMKVVKQHLMTHLDDWGCDFLLVLLLSDLCSPVQQNSLYEDEGSKISCKAAAGSVSIIWSSKQIRHATFAQDSSHTCLHDYAVNTRAVRSCYRVTHP